MWPERVREGAREVGMGQRVRKREFNWEIGELQAFKLIVRI